MEINCGSIAGIISVSKVDNIMTLSGCYVGRTVKAEDTGYRYTITAVNSYGVPTQWERVYSQADYDAVVAQLESIKEELDTKIRGMQSTIDSNTTSVQDLQQRVTANEESISQLTSGASFIKTGSMLSIPMDGGTCYVELIGIDPTATEDNFEISASGFTFTQEPTLTELGNAQGFVMIEFAVGANTTNENGITGSMTITYTAPDGTSNTGTVILKQAYKSANPTYLVTYVDGTTENRYETLVRTNDFDDKRSQIKALRFYSAIQLGDYAFKNCSNLETLTFDNGSLSWGNPVFLGCTKLKEVVLTDVDFGAIGSFENCTALEKATINRSTLGKVTMGNLFFDGCTGLKNVIFGDNVNEVVLGTSCFNLCSSLVSISSTNGSVFALETVSKYTFNGCTSLVNSCFSFANVTAVGEYAFWLCSKLEEIKNITFGSLAYVDQKAFGFSSVETFVANNLRLGNVGVQAFVNSNLKSVRLNKGNLGTIEGLFLDCNSLVSVKDESGSDMIPQLTSIAKSTFSGCGSLSVGSLSSSLTRIEDYTFKGVGTFSASLPSGLSYIGVGAFEDCKNINITSVPSGVTAISDYAFRDSGVSSFTFHSGVLSIGEQAFQGTSLTSITFTSGLQTIGERAFFNCGASTLKSVVIPDSVTTLGEQAFYAAGLSSLTIGSGISKIPYYCFPFNSKLKDIYIRRNSIYVVPQEPSSSGAYNAFFGAGQDYFDNQQGATNKKCKLHLPFAESSNEFATCKANYLDSANHWNNHPYGLQLEPLLVTPVSGGSYEVPEGWVIVGN